MQQAHAAASCMHAHAGASRRRTCTPPPLAPLSPERMLLGPLSGPLAAPLPLLAAVAPLPLAMLLTALAALLQWPASMSSKPSASCASDSASRAPTWAWVR